MKNYLLGFFYFLLIPSLYAQTGAGGVGKTDGTGSLKLWLKPTNYVAGTGVWSDASGFNNHFITAGGTQPTLQAGITNGQAAVRLTADTHYFNNLTVGSEFNSGDWTVYTVFRGSGDNQKPILSWGEFATATERTIGSFYSTNPQEGGMRLGTDFVTISGVDVMAANVVFLGVQKQGGQLKVRLNGNQEQISYPTVLGFSSAEMLIGKDVSGYSNAVSTDMHEIVAYNSILTDLQRILVENYLGAKYNVVLPSNDYYAQETATTYQYDVVGIGSYGGNKQTEANTGGLFIEENNSSLDAGSEFVLWGHNNTAHGSSLGSLPSTVFDRWARDFYIDKTGAVDVKLKFLKSAEALSGNQYVLLYRASTANTYAKVTGVSTGVDDGTYITFSVPNSVFLDGYYTLGNTASSILPVTLYSLGAGGSWNSASAWTLNSDGVTADNPSNYIPDINKGAIILAAATMTVPSDFTSAAFVTVNGTLDLVATTGHNYIKIGGNGRIRVGSGTFPSFTNMTDFVSSTGGTIEFYGSGTYTLPNLPTYNHLEITGGGVKTFSVNKTLNGNFTIGSGTTVISNGKDISLRGNWTNNGIYTTSVNTVTFNNVDQNQSIGGSTETVFNHVNLNKAAARNVELSTNVTMNGTLTLNNGSMVLNEYNLTMTNAAFAVNFTTLNMVVQNGLGVAGQSQLYVKKAGVAAYQMIYPIGTVNNYSPIEITTLAASSGTIDFLTISVISYSPSAADVVKRKWDIGVVGNAVITDARFKFDHRPTDKVGNPQAIINVFAGTPTVVQDPATITANTFANTAAGNTKLAGSWVLSGAPTILYAVANGNWQDASTWATSCGGTGGAGVPNSNTFVVICSPYNVTTNANGAASTQTTVQAGASLILGTTTGHNLGLIDGGGTIRLSSGTFPTHTDIIGFANSATAKIIYEGAGYTIQNLSTQPNTYPSVQFSGSGVKVMPTNNIYVNKNLTIDAGVTLQDNGRNIIIKGDWTNNGTFTPTTPAGLIGQVVFNNTSANQTVGGSTQTTFNRIEVAKASGKNVVLTNGISAQGTITLSYGNIVLGTNNLTLENGASFAHAYNAKFTSVGMVEQNNSVGSGKLIVKRTNIADFANVIYPVGSNGRYSAFDVVGLTGTGSGQIEVVTSQKDFGTLGIGQAKDNNGYVDRIWTVSSSGFTGITNVKVRFEFDALDKDGSPYVTMVDPVGTTPATNPSGWYYDDGTRAFGVSLNGNSYLDGEWFLAPSSTSSNTYYTSQVGEFSNFVNWTTNLSGFSATVAGSPDRPPLGYPQPTDNIVLLPGASISMTNGGNPMNGVQVATTLVRAGATLDLGTATGIKLGTIKGHTDGTAGTIKTASILPTHGSGTDFTAFVTVGAGTFEFNNTTSFTLPTIFITTNGTVNTYNNLTLNLGGNCTTSIATLKNDLLLNGALTVTKGKLQINDNVTTNTVYTLQVTGDTYVETTGCIGVGTANTHTLGLTGQDACSEAPYPYGSYWEMYHKVLLYGNLTNKGKIILTNHPAPVYRENCLTGAASLFIVGNASSPNVVLDIQGQTDLQQLVIDKGINKSIEVLLTSNAYPNFRIFGRNDLRPAAYINFVGTGTDNRDDVLVRKALWVRAGTLRLQGNIFIPSLTEPNGNTGDCGVINSDYLLATNGVMWLDGDFVTVRSGANAAVDTNPSNILGVTGRLDVANTLAASATWSQTGSTAFSVNGLLRVSKGRFIAGAGAGIVMRAEGGEAALLIEGTGTLETSLIRSSVTGAGRASYTQTGGTVIIDAAPNNEYGVYGSFSLSYPNSLFIMSGGDMIIRHTHPGSNAHAAPNPPGGTYRRATAFEVQSAPGNWNVTGGTVTIELGKTQNNNRYEIGSTAPIWNLNIVKTQNTTAKAWVRYFPLTVLNELRITSNSAFANAAILEANSPDAASDATQGLPTSFDVTVGGDMILDGGQYIAGTDKRTIFNGFSTSTATAGIQTITNNQVAGGHNYSPLFENFVVATTQTGVRLAGTSNNRFIVADDLYLTLGTLNDGGKILQAQRHIYNDTEHISTGSGEIELRNKADDTPHYLYGNGNGIFGNLELNETDVDRNAILKANQTIKGTLTLTNGILDIDRYNFHLTTTATFAALTYGTTRMIKTKGLRSDGGVSKDFTASTAPFTFPIGGNITTTPYYTPYTVQAISGATSYGRIGVRVDAPISTTTNAANRHPLTTSTSALTWYWNLNSSGWAGQSIKHSFVYHAPNNDLVNGTESNYVSGFINYPGAGVPTWTTETTTDVVEGSNIVNFDGTGSGVTYIDGDYTAGIMGAFGAFQTFYSIQDGNWTDGNTWSLDGTNKHNGTPAGDYPQAGDVAFISSHTITATANIACDAFTVKENGILDFKNFTHNLGICFGENDKNGTIRINSSNFPSGDLGFFQSYAGGTFEYYTNGANIDVPVTDIPTYRHLVLNPQSTRIITLPNLDLQIHENMTVKGAGTAYISETASGSLDIGNNLSVTETSTLQFRNNGNIRTIKVTGDVNVANGTTFDVQNGGTIANHKLVLRKNLTVNGTLDLSKTTNGRVYTEFISANNASISGTGTLDFERIIINKGIEGATASVEDTAFVVDANATTITLSGNAATDNAIGVNNKPFQLYRGAFKLNSATADFTVNSRAGYVAANPPNATDLAQVFDIPESSILWINQGIIRNTANNWGGGLFLNGKLRISGGSYIGEAAVTTDANHFIEPKATNSSSVEVSAGTLRLGGQIRRAVLSPSGALRYRQSGGTVEVGTQRVSENTRGVFEVLNAGSSFVMSGGDLYIARSSGSLAITDFYAQPSFSSVSGGTVHFGSTNTPNTTQKNMTMQSNIPLWNLTVNSTNSPSVRMIAQNAILQNNLTINTNGTFNANNLDVFIGGNFTNNAAAANYQNSDSTVFNSNRQNQSIIGNVSGFKNLVIDNTYNTGAGQGSVTLQSGNITVSNYLELQSGVFKDNGNTINLQGNAYNASEHQSTGAGKIIFNKASGLQLMNGSGAGTYGNVEINNSANVFMLADHRINGNLTLSNGLLDIENYLLSFSSASSVIGTLSTTKMIRTNGSALLGGIKKDFAAGTFNFLFPLGIKASPDKLTPVRLVNGNATASAGSLTVRAVTGKHPLTTDPATTELQHYWRLTNVNGLSPVSVKQYYQYDQTDIRGDESQYVGAWLNPVTSRWESGTVKVGTVDASNNFMTVDGGTSAANAGLTTLSGDYTAGYPQEFLAIDTFRSVASGNWNDINTWDRIEIPKYGSVVIIKSGHTISANLNRYNTYATEVEAGGILDLNTTSLHELGYILGKGTIKSTFSNLPLGDYSKFVASGGGTIEYAGTTGFALAGIDVYNNLKISNTGLAGITMANVNLTLNGGLTIDASTRFVNKFGKNIKIAGDWTNNGTFENDERGSLVTFNGSIGNQILGGTSDTEFRKLAIDKLAGKVLVNQTTTVHEYLTLKQGIFDVNLSKRILLHATGSDVADPGNATSYVKGLLCKLGNADFVFPVGDTRWARLKIANMANGDDNTIFCSDYYVADHSSNNARTGVSYPSTPTATKLATPLKVVSKQEYWILTRDTDTGNDARVKVSLFYEQAPSYVKYQGHYYDSAGTGEKWHAEPATFISAGEGAASGVLVSNNLWFHNGTTTDADDEVPLPVTLVNFGAKVREQVVDLFWKVVNEEKMLRYVVERSQDGYNFKAIGELPANSYARYELTDKEPFSGVSYYRLRAEGLALNDITYSRVVSVKLGEVATKNYFSLYPNPSNGELHLELNGYENGGVVKIIDLMGNQQNSRKLSMQGGKQVENLTQLLNGLSSGVYLIRLEINGQIHHQKIVLTK